MAGSMPRSAPPVKVRTILRGAALAGAAAAVGVWSSTRRGRDLDERLFKAANGRLGADADRMFQGVTELGSLYASGAAAIALAAAGRRREASRAIAAAGTTWLLGQGLKKAFERPRPYEADEEGTRRMIGKPLGASWPSSHAAVIGAFVGVAGRELAVSRSARAGLSALAATVAASRTYLGVHFPSDGVGGFLLGRAVATLWPRGRGVTPDRGR